MNIKNDKYKTKDGEIINYYEVVNEKPNLLLIHAQGINAMTYKNVLNSLSKKFHIYSVDCYGHGESSHNKEKYNLKDIGNGIIDFIENVIKEKTIVLGHSSGGLIACYIASNSDKCSDLILEDPPLFSSNGEERYNTFNYKDLSTICNNFINQNEEKDFVYYYFINQYCWKFFPEKSREKLKNKLGECALKYRTKHPDKNLKVPFWPKEALEAYNGMNEYDPYFGENFYNNEFNKDINYEELLKNIKCKTLIMKANTAIGKDGILQGAMSDEDLKRASSLIKNNTIEYYDCGHGIHFSKKKQFIKSIIKILER